MNKFYAIFATIIIIGILANTLFYLSGNTSIHASLLLFITTTIFILLIAED